MPTFKALLATQEDGEEPSVSFRELDTGRSLPPGDVLIRVLYSSLNYKDGLAVTGKPGVIRKYPMVPGVDLAGIVEESSSPFSGKRGDSVQSSPAADYRKPSGAATPNSPASTRAFW